ncbi:MAG: Zn-ribbon domain-containing OB-fold protein [Candidatus Hodarchaeota archaeon]
MEKVEKETWIKCKNCGYLQHKSHIRCLKCKNSTFENINASGTCKLLTFTILKAPPAEFRKNSSYALGVVEFENGVKALGQLTIQENLKTGMELKPIYTKICDDLDGKEIYNYVFSPN